MSAVPFEGPEKKLELVVRGQPSLRTLSEATWRGVVEAAGACVLSCLRGELVDAYLLSESSLFVWDDRLTMLTCGRTHLVDAVFAMLELFPAESVALLVYERKNEHFPERQPSTFVEDARLLRQHLPGRALRFGAEHEHRVMLYGTTAPFAPAPDDTTLEVLMHGIDPRWLETDFTAAAQHELAHRARTLLPDFRVDEHIFDPAGYSLNAIRGDRYYTIHVTPQRVGSYASFETNMDFRGGLKALLQPVLDLFAPEAFDVVSFVPEASPAQDESLMLADAVLRKHVVTKMCGYRVGFRHYFHPTSTQPAAEVDLKLP
ncbi:MAG: adenosylmethionine decarboxylase [Deltaproteobacteria bacterium]|nr:adenosylmethionine decarboxylase [Deltaproteobacteria bacterium]